MFITDHSGIALLLDSAERRMDARASPLVLIASSLSVERVLITLADHSGVMALLAAQLPAAPART